MERGQGGNMESVIRRLTHLRRAAKAMLIGETGAWLAAVWVAGGVAVAFIDYFLRMPASIRGGWLLAGAAIAVWLLFTRVIPAIRFRPPLTEFALRVERSEAGKRAQLPGVLASAVDMAVGRESGSAAMSRPVMEEAARRASKLRVWTVLRPQRTLAALAAVCAMAALVAGVFTVQPALAAVGSLRILAPWSAAQWPKRTDIEVAGTAKVHPLGTALPLRAALLSSAAGAAHTRVEARYRLIEPDGTAGPVRRVTLTSQDRPVEVNTLDSLGKPVVASGVLFERLIEPAALEPSEAHRSAADLPGELEFWFTSQDDATEPQRVVLARPPQVVGATAVVTPPAYLPPAQTRADLGPGSDERATVGGVLAGSRVELTFKLNKPVPDPATSGLTAAAARAWLSSSLGEQLALVADRSADADAPTALQTSFQGDTWTLGWTVRDSVRLHLRPIDRFGIESDGESTFRVEAREDRPPEATVTVPAEDTEALPTATLEITAEGRDDVSLESIASEWRLARKPSGSEGAAPEPTADYAVLTTADGATIDSGLTDRVITVTGKLDLAQIGAAAGDEVWITALAKDRFELDGRKHEPVRSAMRKVRVISREQLVEQVWQELGSVRRTAIRMAEQQQALRDAVEQNRDGAGTTRDQASLTESAIRQDRAVERLTERVKANALRDEEITSVLDEARSLLQRAREASAEASGDLRKAQEAKAASDQSAAEEARTEAATDQARAQESLEQLADLLDKGEDAWSVRRGIERLLEDQKNVRGQTGKLGEQTVGKSVDELSPQQRQEAAQLAEQQDVLSQRAEDALNRLQQNAEQMRQQDPATAAALEEAARKAERARMQQQMEQAAKDIQQNRQQSATQQQDKAIEAMEQMLDQMKQASRSRDEILQRELASLVESLAVLIKRQERELASLAAAEPTGKFEDLDQGMIGLYTNTRAVHEQARAAGREVRDVASLIEAAATAQGDAVTALRAATVNAPAARTAEELSLEKLNEARAKADEARQAAQERNNRRQRAELKKAYRELLDEQVDLRTRTKDVSSMEAGRRQRAAARDLSVPQDQIRQKAADLAAQTGDIGKSEMFSFAHERFSDATSTAATRLGEGEANSAVVGRQTAAIRILQSILEALSDADRNNDDLRDQNQGEDGSGGGQGGGQQQDKSLIPDSAELKLLRALQAEALLITREADETHDPAAVAEALALQQALVERAKAVLAKLKDQMEPRAVPEHDGDEQPPPPEMPQDQEGQP